MSMGCTYSLVSKVDLVKPQSYYVSTCMLNSLLHDKCSVNVSGVTPNMIHRQLQMVRVINCKWWA